MTGMGGAVLRPDEFNSSRWLRVGATPEQLAALEEQFAALDFDQRVAENARIASMPDGELASSLGQLPETPEVVQAAQPPANPYEAGLPQSDNGDEDTSQYS